MICQGIQISGLTLAISGGTQSARRLLWLQAA